MRYYALLKFKRPNPQANGPVSWGFISVMKQYDKKLLGRKEFISLTVTYISLSSKAMKAVTHSGQEFGGRS